MVAPRCRSVVAGGAVRAGEADLGDGGADDLADAAPPGVGDVDGAGGVDGDPLRRRQRDGGRGRDGGARGGAAAPGDDGDRGADDRADAVAAGVGDVARCRGVDGDALGSGEERDGGGGGGDARGGASASRDRVAVVAAVRRRTQLRPVSATITSPVEATATPAGPTATARWRRRCPVLQVVVAPPPANRVTVPDVSTLRMQWRRCRRCRRCRRVDGDAAGRVHPQRGHRAGEGARARAPPVPPAKVEMVPLVATTRMRLLPESAMKTRPSGATRRTAPGR